MSPPYMPPPYTAPPYNPYTPTISAAKRFLKALIFAILFLALFSFLTGSIHYWGNDPRFDTNIPHSISLANCTRYRNNGNSGTSFSLPISSTSLFLLSRTPKSGGEVKLRRSNLVGDSITVDVIVSSRSYFALNNAKICSLTRDEHKLTSKHGLGVGIFTPLGWLDRFHFDVTVTFPAFTNDAPLLINSFETDLPHFAHTVGDLGGLVDFRNLQLQGSNKHIIVDSLNAETAHLYTSNAPIIGSFESSAALTLHTTNAHVDTRIRLHNDNSTTPTTLSMMTTNAALDSSITLLAPSTSNSTNGVFSITSSTSNARLSLTYPTAPLNSTLYSFAATCNAPTFITLHPTFEGQFAMRTTNDALRVNRRSAVQDPAGLNRTRMIKEHIDDHGGGWLGGRILTGSVCWSLEAQERGNVDLRTSNGAVVLTV